MYLDKKTKSIWLRLLSIDNSDKRHAKSFAHEWCEILFAILPLLWKTESVNNNFKIESKRITNVIRHKVSKKLYKVKLYDGDTIKEVIITEDHSIMCQRGDTLLEIKIGEIKDGDKLLYRVNDTLM